MAPWREKSGFNFTLRSVREKIKRKFTPRKPPLPSAPESLAQKRAQALGIAPIERGDTVTVDV